MFSKPTNEIAASRPDLIEVSGLAITINDSGFPVGQASRNDKIPKSKYSVFP